MRRSVLSRIDYKFIALFLLVSGIGLAMLWSASQGPTGAVTEYAVRQAGWMTLGLATMACAMALDYGELVRAFLSAASP